MLCNLSEISGGLFVVARVLTAVCVMRLYCGFVNTSRHDRDVFCDTIEYKLKKKNLETGFYPSEHEHEEIVYLKLNTKSMHYEILIMSFQHRNSDFFKRMREMQYFLKEILLLKVPFSFEVRRRFLSKVLPLAKELRQWIF